MKVKRQHKDAPKTSITQRLQTDLGRLLGVINPPIVVKPVYWIDPNLPINRKNLCNNEKDTHLENNKNNNVESIPTAICLSRSQLMSKSSSSSPNGLINCSATLNKIYSIFAILRQLLHRLWMVNMSGICQSIGVVHRLTDLKITK